MDCIVEITNDVYIFELKLDGSAAEAILQINDKGYAREYETDARRIHKIGCNFSSETGTNDGWEVELKINVIKKMAKVIKDPIFPECPIRNVLARICDKWSMLVLFMLEKREGEPIRFNALRKLIPDISQKMLTSTLRTLEEDGLVVRQVYAEVPPRVEYSLTPRAHSLIPIVDNLVDWAADNMAAILKDREKKVS